MRLGIDFGTTNSSIARFDGNSLHRLELDPANDNSHVLPSLIYIDRKHASVVGTPAATEYLKRETGRAVSWEKRNVGEIDFMGGDMFYVETVHIMVDAAAAGRLLQYVKTGLRDPQYEGTRVFDRFYTVDELIAILLRWLKLRAEQEFGEESHEVVIGRPVRFSDDPAVADRAEEILFKAARWAGFNDIRFELEPIGATYYYHRSAPKRQTALVFDFGGGTLDLTVAELGGNVPPNILATHGVLVGGDDLDRRIMKSLRPYFGGTNKAGTNAVPDYFLDPLDNWQTMPILSRPAQLKMMDDFKRAGASPRAISALRTLVTRNLGFTLFREIEQAKKRLSDKFITPLDFVFEDIDIHETITRRDFEKLIVEEIEKTEAGVRETLAQARLEPSQIDVVLRTGGTSAVPAFTALLENIFGEEKLAQMDLLTSVVGGLAIIAYEGGGHKSRCETRYDLEHTPVPGSIRARSTSAYDRYQFRIGAQCYRDHAYTLKRILVELSGLPAIRTAQEDKNSASKLFLQFELAQPTRVYIAFDATTHSIPNWLRPFKTHIRQIEVDQWGTERQLRLYYKDFPAGRVQLGGNRAAGQRGDVFMNYLVVLQAQK
ncbi:MAG: Hsp70 family protein [Chloroflexi bacterium]|nr:Hsp70 family protein [Chloroflexota bacterium]